MKPGGLRLYTRALTWTLSCAGGGYLLMELWFRGSALLPWTAPTLILLAGGSVSAQPPSCLRRDV